VDTAKIDPVAHRGGTDCCRQGNPAYLYRCNIFRDYFEIASVIYPTVLSIINKELFIEDVALDKTQINIFTHTTNRLKEQIVKSIGNHV
jgi:hypothetical protein